MAYRCSVIRVVSLTYVHPKIYVLHIILHCNYAASGVRVKARSLVIRTCKHWLPVPTLALRAAKCRLHSEHKCKVTLYGKV